MSKTVSCRGYKKVEGSQAVPVYLLKVLQGRTMSICSLNILPFNSVIEIVILKYISVLRKGFPYSYFSVVKRQFQQDLKSGSTLKQNCCLLEAGVEALAPEGERPLPGEAEHVCWSKM